jgi:hypothetical protein
MKKGSFCSEEGMGEVSSTKIFRDCSLCNGFAGLAVGSGTAKDCKVFLLSINRPSGNCHNVGVVVVVVPEVVVVGVVDDDVVAVVAVDGPKKELTVILLWINGPSAFGTNPTTGGGTIVAGGSGRREVVVLVLVLALVLPLVRLLMLAEVNVVVPVMAEVDGVWGVPVTANDCKVFLLSIN